MSPAHYIDQLRRSEAIMRRHMRRAEAYREAVRVMRQMSYHDMPDFSVPFKPIHYYTHFIPALTRTSFRRSSSAGASCGRSM